MSKNVAVFVDVANIFYAAKAAGVDIDYVTLLKSATAGRDFVRAYAYTGLDPENENQRHFHEFLKRSGYKVVSKDIRKYGDGRIKANLDIELVVDLMRMAQHIDYAVVISGDGDFAPAIRAVQQAGVRVEVISFRGNTSSDLIDVADVFTEIASIARVEKGARSGRRIAAEDDLSMTAVPEKETDMGPRRRRGGRRESGRDERPVRPAAAGDGGLPGNVIVLPGERLSRAASDIDEDEEIADEVEVEVGEAGDVLDHPDAEGETGEGRRRRRRRGGRGRGRGRRADGEAGEAIGSEAPAGEDEEEFQEEELAPLPQHSTFGSVWDSQIGQPAAGPVVGDDDEGDDDEPEVPEYLLAERRQQGRCGGPRGGGNRNCGGRGGRQAGYQSAVDRERYGRGGGSMYGGGGVNRMPAGRPTSAGPRGGGQPPQHRRPQPQLPPQRESMPTSGSAEPWSEVPPEVQEMLRAEMARRQGSAARGGQGTQPAPRAQSGTPDGRQPDRRRGPRPAVPSEPAAATLSEPALTLTTEPVGATRRSRSGATGRARPTAEAVETTGAAVPTALDPQPAPPAQDASPAPRRRTARTATEAPTSAVPAAPVADAPVTKAASPRTRSTRKAATSEGAATSVAQPVPEAPAPAPRRRTTKAAPTAPSDEASAADGSAPVAKPPTRRRITRVDAASLGTSTSAAPEAPAQEAKPAARRRATKAATPTED